MSLSSGGIGVKRRVTHRPPPPAPTPAVSVCLRSGAGVQLLLFADANETGARALQMATTARAHSFNALNAAPRCRFGLRGVARVTLTLDCLSWSPRATVSSSPASQALVRLALGMISSLAECLWLGCRPRDQRSHPSATGAWPPLPGWDGRGIRGVAVQKCDLDNEIMRMFSLL